MANDKIDAEYHEIELDPDKQSDDLKKRAEQLIQDELAKVAGLQPSAIGNSGIKSYVPVATDKPPIDIQKFKAEKQNAVASDNLLQMIRKGSNSFALIDKVLEEIAEEAACLKFDRDKNDDVFQLLSNSTKISKARSQILKIVGDLLVTKRELSKSESVNLRSKRMQAVFKYFMSIIKSSLDGTDSMMPEQKELFWANLQKNLKDFEDSAERIMAKVEDD